jgi:hypothetical protein
MPIINRTPVVADYRPGGPDANGERLGMLVAKATFRMLPDGTTELDSDDPYPLYWLDQPTTLGLLPRDDLPRFEEEPFEVVVLGTAYSKNGRPVHELTVALAIGDVRREIRVYGDRTWRVRGAEAVTGEPRVFTSMPLVWERAFGGTAEIEVDDGMIVPIRDERNPAGKGFDPLRNATSLARAFSPDRAFPRAPAEPRSLPNLEDPSRAIRALDDEPFPVCWSTVPIGSPLHAARCLETKTPFVPQTLGFYRAHPDWLIPRPPRGARVTMDGFSKHGSLSFRLPSLRVIADYSLSGRSGRRELVPQMLVLLPGERRLYITYRRRVIVPPLEPRAPTFRLRVAEGWRSQESAS